MAKQYTVPDVNLNPIGNVLGGLALAFIVDGLLSLLSINGQVAQTLPDPVRGVLGFLIFIGVFVYAYKQLKRLN